MDKFLTLLAQQKTNISAAAGIIAGCISSVTGGWTAGMTALVTCMIVDYIMGIVVAAHFNNSPKSEHGGLNSQVGWKGLTRKVFTMCLVVVAHQIDVVAGTAFFRDAMVVGFFVNELISIAENAGLMGIHMPAVFDKAIDILQKKGEDGQDE